jgi:hypothetical protein
LGADAEMYKRLRKVFGKESVAVLPAIPLSFARLSDTSLTNDQTTGYHGFHMGIRREYRDSYTHFHRKNTHLKYAFPQKQRPFAIPWRFNAGTSPIEPDTRMFNMVLVSDFRTNANDLVSIIENQRKSTANKSKIGLVHLEKYDFDETANIDTQIRDLIDGDSVQMLVYGDNVTCSQMMVFDHSILVHHQIYTPKVTVKGNATVIVTDATNLDSLTIQRCQKSLQHHFDANFVWDVQNDSVLTMLSTQKIFEDNTVQWSSKVCELNIAVPATTETTAEKKSGVVEKSKQEAIRLVNEMAKVYSNDLTPVQIEKLKAEYVEKGLDKMPDTFVLYRIIGNDLYPRHKKGQSRENVQFVLENEPVLKDCERRWIVNRIIDKDEEKAILEMLDKHKQKYVVLPFDASEYSKCTLDLECLPEPGFLSGDKFEKLGPEQQQRLIGALYRNKNNYVMNNNGARNAALRDGRDKAKYVLPWDGNCFMTTASWDLIREGIANNPHYKYFVVPMTRVLDNSDLLRDDFIPDPVEEPQLAFRFDAAEEFNETFCYGRRPKVETFYRLGIPGKWDKWKDDPWDQKRRDLSLEAKQFTVAGWVARMYSGMKELEQDNQQSFKQRGLARLDAIITTLQHVDCMVSGVNDKTLTSLKAEVLSREEQEYKSHKNELLKPIIEKLVADADEALTRGPYSVVDKTTLPPSQNIHDYWHPAPYWWPNPNTPDGLPYIKKDGQRVPGTSMYEPESEKYDRTRLQRLFDDTFTLALAWKFTGEIKYAQHGARALERFFINPETAMNPHLQYAQVRLGHTKSIVSTGIIESGVIDTQVQEKFKQWLNTYLQWLLESPQGKKECSAVNNHGTCYDLQVAAIAAFVGNREILFETLTRSQSRVAQQFTPAGDQPHEMTRTITAHYCCFNFQSWINIAEVASRYNINLWETTTRDGASMIKVAEYLIGHIGKKWPFQQIDEFDHDRFMPIYFAVKDRIRNVSNAPDVPKIKYLVKPSFFPHDGVRPYWNLG